MKKKIKAIIEDFDDVEFNNDSQEKQHPYLTDTDDKNPFEIVNKVKLKYYDYGYYEIFILKHSESGLLFVTDAGNYYKKDIGFVEFDGTIFHISEKDKDEILGFKDIRHLDKLIESIKIKKIDKELNSINKGKIDKNKVLEVLDTLEKFSMFIDGIDSVSFEQAVLLWKVVEYVKNNEDLDDILLT